MLLLKLCHGAKQSNKTARIENMRQFIMYFQPECHLCDEAEVFLLQAGLEEKYTKIDIESDLELLKQYGIYVPVLKRDDNQELFWPFDVEGIRAFLDLKG